MDDAQRRALAALRFNWAPTPDDVWQPPAFHIEGLHRAAVRLVLDGVKEARNSDRSSPIGVAIIGSRGTGKTHLLGSVRERVQAEGGYFFLISLLDASAFWRSTILSMIDGFSRETAGKETQLRVFLRNLVDELGAPRAIRRAVTGDTALTRPSLDAFVDLLRKRDRQLHRVPGHGAGAGVTRIGRPRRAGHRQRLPRCQRRGRAERPGGVGHPAHPPDGAGGRA